MDATGRNPRSRGGRPGSRSLDGAARSTVAVSTESAAAVPMTSDNGGRRTTGTPRVPAESLPSLSAEVRLQSSDAQTVRGNESTHRRSRRRRLCHQCRCARRARAIAPGSRAADRGRLHRRGRPAPRRRRRARALAEQRPRRPGRSASVRRADRVLRRGHDGRHPAPVVGAGGHRRHGARDEVRRVARAPPRLDAHQPVGDHRSLTRQEVSH